MKKLLLSLIAVCCITFFANAQCINTGQFPSNDITINNDGNPNIINTCVFTGDYSQLVGATIGDDYIFTITGNSNGANKYLTVTDGSDVVIAMGQSPLTVTNITSATIRLHYTEDDTCTTQSACSTASYQNVSACVAPLNLNAVPTDSTAQLSWTAGSIETSWQVEVVPAGTTPTGTGVTVNATSYTATGLTANTNYDFYVRSDCGGGDFSIWVGPESFLTLPTCPATGDPFLINLFNDGAGISWFANGSETMWDVEYGPTGFTIGTGTLVQGLTTTDYTITGQLSETTYDAYVRAVCEGNDLSPWSNAVTYTTLTSCPTPSALIASNMTTTTVDVSWLEGESETMWEIEYGPTGFTQGTGTIVPVTTNPFTLTGLDVDTSYDIYLRADCGGGDFSMWTGPETFSTTPTCLQPTNLVVANVLATTADISWTAGATETAWELEYGPAGFVQGTGTVVMVTTNPYSLTGLDTGTVYEIYVRADCGATDGLSQWTGPVEFTTEADYCSGDAFTDSGGLTGDYGNGENITYTICPDNPGDVVYVNFTFFSTENIGSTGCFDGLTIYDGGDTTATLIPPPNGTDIWCWDRDDATPDGTGDLQGMTLISTDASGCLTFVFTSDGSVSRDGWEAAVTCGPPPTCPAPSDLVASNVTATSVEHLQLGILNTDQLVLYKELEL